ncbi:MAG: hypothetical protein AUG44_14380 [Actinobacteria bacterium 13_1_20CM_3_71_11]|nr:MAG: hypothetical protein AUG44_14380 [Actinobacteria bacterium 13_1_20CM_3_71_11]
MTPARLAALVSGAYPPGVYRWRSRAHPGALGRELAGCGWSGYALDGVTDPVRLFEECAGIMTFPSWFGHTWAGLVDCLADLSWLPGTGHVLLWERYGAFAADATAWRQAYDALGRAVAARARYPVPPLFVLLRGSGPEVSPLDGTPIPVLPVAPPTGPPVGRRINGSVIAGTGRATGPIAGRASGSGGSRPRRAR